MKIQFLTFFLLRALVTMASDFDNFILGYFGFSQQECLIKEKISHMCVSKARAYRSKVLSALSTQKICEKTCEYIKKSICKETYIQDFKLYLENFPNFTQLAASKEQFLKSLETQNLSTDLFDYLPIIKSVNEAVSKWSESQMELIYKFVNETLGTNPPQTCDELAASYSDQFLIYKIVSKKNENTINDSQTHLKTEPLNYNYSDSSDLKLLNLLEDKNNCMNSSLRNLLLDFLRENESESMVSSYLKTDVLGEKRSEYLDRIIKEIMISYRSRESCKNLFEELEKDANTSVIRNPIIVLKLFLFYCSSANPMKNGSLISSFNSSRKISHNKKEAISPKKLTANPMPKGIINLNLRIVQSNNEKRLYLYLLEVMKAILNETDLQKEAKQITVQTNYRSLEQIFLESWKEAKLKVFSRKK